MVPAPAGGDRKDGKVMPLTRCPSCGNSSFTFARRPYVAHCPNCGKPLNDYQDTTAIENEIRERLYGRRSNLTTPRIPVRS
jgi:ribosomal protein S27E